MYIDLEINGYEVYKVYNSLNLVLMVIYLQIKINIFPTSAELF